MEKNIIIQDLPKKNMKSNYKIIKEGLAMKCHQFQYACTIIDKNKLCERIILNRGKTHIECLQTTQNTYVTGYNSETVTVEEQLCKVNALPPVVIATVVHVHVQCHLLCLIAIDFIQMEHLVWNCNVLMGQSVIALSSY